MSQVVVGRLALLGVSVVWGANFTAMRVLLDRLDPLDIASLRTAIAAVGFALVLLARRRRLPRLSRAEWGRVALLGVLGVAVFNLATVTGQRLLPASLSSLIVSSSPIFTAAFAIALGFERASARMAGSLALATAGLALLVLRGRDPGAVLTPEVALSAAILTAAPVAWAAYTVLAKPLLARHEAVPVAAVGMFAGAAMLAPLLVLDPGRRDRIAALDAAGWAAFLFSSLVSLVLGFILFSWGLRALSPSQASMTTYLTPVVAVLVAWAALGEQPTPGLLAGGALILVAVVVATTAAGQAPSSGGAPTPTPRIRPAPR